MTSALMPYKDLEAMAADVVRSGMFPGIKTPSQAMTLFLLAQAEGLHPMTAAIRYNIIDGKPGLKADAMLAEFMKRGGTVNWLEWNNDACEAEFKSKGCPGGVRVRWTIADAERAGLVQRNPNYRKFPRQQLKARVASDGVRMADPSVNYGRHTPEEVADFEEPRKAADAEVVDGAPESEAVEVGEPAPAASTIESASGLSTEEYLAEAKARSAAAVAAMAPPLTDADVPFETLLEKEREKIAKKIGRPKSVPEFCECGKPVLKHESTDGSSEYWECAMRHSERHKMKERGEADSNIREALKGHYFKWQGRA